jgi:hypothetical protein
MVLRSPTYIGGASPFSITSSVLSYRNERFVRDSKALTADPLPYIRTQTLSLIFTLLKDRPEQEQNLLRLLIWKLVRVSNRYSIQTVFIALL